MVLQVLYINSGHWACLRVQQGEVFLYYDSVYLLASNETLHIIAQLVQSKERSLRIQLMNVAKQSGSVDCGLYALAMLTCLLLNTDPTTIVFESDKMRPHLVQILQCGKVSVFPIRKHRQPVEKVLRNQEIQIYCYCRLPDWAHDSAMVCCDSCHNWFH